jgi:hypothetical protein
MAGMAACLWQSKQSIFGITNIDLLHIIEASSSRYHNPNALLGYGIPNFKKAYLTLIDSLDSSTDLTILDMYPNPVSVQQLQLLIQSNFPQEVSVNLINLQGQTMHHQVLQLEEGGNFIQILTKDFPNGAYFLEVNGASDNSTHLVEKIEFLN